MYDASHGHKQLLKIINRDFENSWIYLSPNDHTGQILSVVPYCHNSNRLCINSPKTMSLLLWFLYQYLKWANDNKTRISKLAWEPESGTTSYQPTSIKHPFRTRSYMQNQRNMSNCR
jgi:hypothetical protein